MSLVTLAQAKLHLRVDGTDEDSLIQIYINAAEQDVANTLQRNIYADSTTLNAAITAAPTTLASATVAYEAAVAAAELIEDVDQQDVALAKAREDYFHAIEESKRTNRGLVINDTIKSAILLLVGHLYGNREEVVVGLNMAAMPQHIIVGVQYLLNPFKAY